MNLSDPDDLTSLIAFLAGGYLVAHAAFWVMVGFRFA